MVVVVGEYLSSVRYSGFVAHLSSLSVSFSLYFHYRPLNFSPTWLSRLFGFGPDLPSFWLDIYL